MQSMEQLEEKLNTLDTEKAELQSQLQYLTDLQKRKEENLLARYINADHLLAQWQSILPLKRVTTPKLASALNRCASQSPTTARLLEPASNLMYTKMYDAIKETQLRTRQSSDDLIAWQFDPESSSGKRLMSRMRQLLNENESLGRMNHTDRVALLEAETNAQTNCIKEFNNTQEGIECVLNEASADLEGLQSSLLILHRQINDAESVVQALQNEVEERQPGRVAELMKTVVAQLEGETDQDPSLEPNPEVEIELNASGMSFTEET